MIKKLCEHSNTSPDEWDKIDGPETGVGVEAWYVHKASGQVAYCCDDQGHITVDVIDEG